MPQSFNLVTQQDSRVMWQDNQTMKAIAFMTLFFLPMATVAVSIITTATSPVHARPKNIFTDSILIKLWQTFFGCQFFALDVSTSPPSFRVSPQIWIFCLIFVILMILMLPMWRMIQLGAGNLASRPGNVNTVIGNRENGKGLNWKLVTRKLTRSTNNTVELTSTATSTA